MSALLWALLALPLGAGAVLVLASLAPPSPASPLPPRAADRVAPGAALVTALLTLGLACAAAVRRPGASAPLLEGMPARFAVDGLSAVMVVTVAAVTTAVLAFAASGADRETASAPARFHGLMLLFSGAMLVTVTATGFPALLMGWEVMGAASWALIGHLWRDTERIAGANTAFLTTRASDLGLYVAAGAMLADPGGSGWRDLALAGIVLAALGKSAQLPFSFWLSSAMRGPAPVSALLHSATMVAAGAYLLLRYAPALRDSGWGADLVMWAGALTALALGLVAVAQHDIKQLLAASSSAQIGFMVLAAGVGSVGGGTLQLLAHAAAKSLAFLVAGAWLTSYGTRELARLRGVAATGQRTRGITFSVAALTLAGLPPFAVWAAKDVVLATARGRSPAVHAVALAASLVAALYSAKLLYVVWHRPLPASTEPGAPAPVSRATWRESRGAGPLLVLAVACAGLTAVALPPLWSGFVGTGAPLHGWEPAASGAGALLVCAVVWRRGARGHAAPGTLAAWLRLEGAVRRVLVGPTLGLARALAAFDVRGLDRAIEGAARAVPRAARVAANRVEPAVDGAVEGFAEGLRALARRARTPQTGQLHQYLAQAVAACVFLALVLALVR